MSDKSNPQKDDPDSGKKPDGTRPDPKNLVDYVTRKIDDKVGWESRNDDWENREGDEDSSKEERDRI
jgi:hypothetical protein